ncbi:MAG: DUF4917 family protein [Flavipsychrobacter sp.]|nr:DUF4917 family protein [Flavipsychrobacter sp.]
MTLISFEDAITMSTNYTKRHLLLGNGFSIACIPSIFTYGSLFSRADFSKMPEIEKVFRSLKTEDFEMVIDGLENSSKIISAYDASLNKLADTLHEHSQALKEKLIETVAYNHPAFPSIIENDKYRACIKFLKNFIDGGGNIYTLNYDLLLYWSLMFGMNDKLIDTTPSDGFGRDTDYQDGEVFVNDYITWQGDSKAHGQNIHYLHGALHIYDHGHEVQKFTWTDTHKPLINQAKEALESSRFPLFVAEGQSKKKMEKIIHCGYLFHSYKSFSSVMKVGNKTTKYALFTYGVSFSENDAHIINKIPQGKVAHLFVSIFGNPDTEKNKAIIASAEMLKRKRRSGDLEITYYDASSANVWE